jgi:molybdopterin converting factor small subunit
MSTLVYAIGEEMVPPEHVLTDGERIELIPPISGG